MFIINGDTMSKKVKSTAVVMIQGKPWYQSKTIWAAIVGAGISVASAFLGETNAYVSLAITLASALGIYGRATATTGVTK